MKEEGWEVFTGNELLVKGLLEVEGGTHLWTGYPGSPIAGFFDTIETIQALLKKNGIHATIANNEALASAALNGSQMEGLRSIAVMKSVGVHVASDALALGNLAGAHPEGGAMVVLGDDPWNDSTQVPTDSRYLCKHLHMPVLEPSTPQELKDWVEIGFKLSAESELYMGYLVTTNQADGGGSVVTRRNHFPRVNTLHKTTLDTSTLNPDKNVLLPPRTSQREVAFTERYQRLWESSRKYGVNQLRNPNKKAPFAFVTSAMAYSYLCHALEWLGVLDQFPILKLGVTYPIDPSVLAPLAELTSTLIVVEERRGFIEEQLAQIIFQQNYPFKLYGKVFPNRQPGISDKRGLNPSIVAEKLAPWIEELVKSQSIRGDSALIARRMKGIGEVSKYNLGLVARTPTFCPGCPHRDSSSVLMQIKRQFRDPKYMRRKHHGEPVDLVFHGDTGCYTMLMFEPTKDLMHNYSGMGLGGGTGSGIDPFITNKQVVFMGDSTFFHSGQIAISNSVKNNQDITYIILDNKTTAMTGHQPTPGVEDDILGNKTFIQHIDDIVQAIVEEENVVVIRTDPSNREEYKVLLEKTILKDGVKVIIANKECGITSQRRVKSQENAVLAKKGFLPEKTYVNIAQEACEYCLECTKATGCPGLTFAETDFGRKMQTDLSWCVGDLACTKLDSCPAFELVTIHRNQKPEKHLKPVQPEDLPEPATAEFKSRWHAYLAGVGGMGIATSTAVLVRTAHRQGYKVLFCDKRGLAIRNGGVYSQITIAKDATENISPLIPYGTADLILGLDPLEAARGMDAQQFQRVGHPQKTAVMINRFKTPTILSLLGKSDFSLETLEQSMRKHAREDAFYSYNLSEISERYFGTKLFVNVMMLGAAFQAGLLPFTLENLEWGLRETVGKRFPENWSAFNLGRKIYLDSPSSQVQAGERSYLDVIKEKSVMLRKQSLYGERVAQRYARMTHHAVERIRLDAESLRHLALRIYDLIQYGGVNFAQEYIDDVASIFQRDSEQKDYAVTKAVLRNLHRVMTIKDEIYVAHLLTCEEKYARDRQKYQVYPSLGDRIEYRHLNQPEFAFGPFKIRFRIHTRDWMLRLMSRAKFLRKLMPGWHRKERLFRNWYIRLLAEFSSENETFYEHFLEIYRSPEQVTGYREIRYPKMDAARQKVSALMSKIEEPSQSQTAIPATVV